MYVHSKDVQKMFKRETQEQIRIEKNREERMFGGMSLNDIGAIENEAKDGAQQNARYELMYKRCTKIGKCKGNATTKM